MYKFKKINNMLNIVDSVRKDNFGNDNVDIIFSQARCLCLFSGNYNLLDRLNSDVDMFFSCLYCRLWNEKNYNVNDDLDYDCFGSEMVNFCNKLVSRFCSNCFSLKNI